MNLSFARRSALLALVALMVIGVAACTEPTAPTAPTVTTFQPILAPILNPSPKVDGVYQGTLLFQDVTGGADALRSAGGKECVAQAYEAAVLNGNDSNDASMIITQDTTNSSLVKVRLASEETGLACTYNGAIGSNNGLISDALPGDCNSGGTDLIIRCLPDPVTGVILIRQLHLIGSSLSATFDGWPTSVTGATGRTAQTYNILDPDGKPVGGLVFNHTFFVFRR
jgi:hypothetical protein